MSKFIKSKLNKFSKSCNSNMFETRKNDDYTSQLFWNRNNGFWHSQRKNDRNLRIEKEIFYA